MHFPWRPGIPCAINYNSVGVSHDLQKVDIRDALYEVAQTIRDHIANE